MAKLGKDVLVVGAGKIGQEYRLGADVPLDNANWREPWDCAEYASWCVYQAYGVIFGAGQPSKLAKAEPYSGYWFSEAKTKFKLPPDFLHLKSPNFKSTNIVLLQKALLKAGIDPGSVDGEFGPMTHSALVSFQAREGLEVDGAFEKVTASKLGLSFPISAP